MKKVAYKLAKFYICFNGRDWLIETQREREIKLSFFADLWSKAMIMASEWCWQRPSEDPVNMRTRKQSNEVEGKRRVNREIISSGRSLYLLFNREKGWGGLGDYNKLQSECSMRPSIISGVSWIALISIQDDFFLQILARQLSCPLVWNFYYPKLY